MALEEPSFCDRSKLLQIPASEAARMLERKCHEIYNELLASPIKKY